MLFILTKLNKRKLQTSKCKLQPKATYISSWEIIWFRDSSWVEAPSRLQRGQGSGGWLSAVRAAKTPLPSLPPPILGVCPPPFHPTCHQCHPNPTGITYQLPATVSSRGPSSWRGSPAPPSSRWISALACTADWEQLRDLGWAMGGSGAELATSLWICS